MILPLRGRAWPVTARGAARAGAKPRGRDPGDGRHHRRRAGQPAVVRLQVRVVQGRGPHRRRAEPDELAELSGEQVANIGSQDMNDAVWLKLAKRVNELLATRDVDGIVDHPRHRHDGGDGVLPRTWSSRATSPSCWSVDAARRPRSAPTGPATSTTRVPSPPSPRRARPRRAGRAQRRDPLRAQRHQDRHDQRRDVREPEPRPGRAGAHRQDRVVRAARDKQAHDALGVRGRGADAAAPRRHHLRARQHEPGS